MDIKQSMFLPREGLQLLVDLLLGQGYDCVGPQLSEGTIVYRSIREVSSLPQGIRDEQAPGRYTVHQQEDSRQFAWANGAQCLKPLVFSPREPLWRSEKSANSIQFSAIDDEVRATAVIGVRSCDLAALTLQDAHFMYSDMEDSHYRRRREQLFLVAVNCSHPSASCFCASTGDGPVTRSGADLILDELDDGFVCQARSIRGADVLMQLPAQPLTEKLGQQVVQQREQAIAVQQRTVPEMHGKLASLVTHSLWQSVAQRCLSCGNCTAVCPSCFCHSQHEEVSLDLNKVEQVRQWDSCFHTDHSYIHGFVIRAETAHRYRQWLTHKFDYWHDQYGRSGCTGCGRCITWCPVGIDVTQVLNDFVESANE